MAAKKTTRGKSKKHPSKKKTKSGPVRRLRTTFHGPVIFLNKGDDLSLARHNKSMGLPANFDFSKVKNREELNRALEKTTGEWDLDATRFKQLDRRGRPIKPKKTKRPKKPGGVTRLATPKAQLSFGKAVPVSSVEQYLQDILASRKMPKQPKGTVPLKAKVDIERAGRDLAYNDWLRETQNVKIDTDEISALRNARNRIKRQLIERQRAIGVANDNRTRKKRKVARSDFSAKAQAIRATAALIAKKRKTRKKKT